MRVQIYILVEDLEFLGTIKQREQRDTKFCDSCVDPISCMLHDLEIRDPRLYAQLLFCHATVIPFCLHVQFHSFHQCCNLCNFGSAQVSSN